MGQKYRRSYQSFKKNIPQVFVILTFFMGIIIGSLFSNSLDSLTDSGLVEISKLVDGFILKANSNQLYDPYIMGASFLTYSKQVILIWLFGLFPITIPLIGVLLGLQGFSYGFTTAFFVIKYNFKGLLLCMGAYGLHGTLFVLLIILLSIEAIRFGRKDRAVSPKVYFIYLLVAIISVGLISLYEAYLVPLIMQNIIRLVF